MGLVMGIPVRALKSCTRFQISLLRHVSFFATITAAACHIQVVKEEGISPRREGQQLVDATQSVTYKNHSTMSHIICKKKNHTYTHMYTTITTTTKTLKASMYLCF